MYGGDLAHPWYASVQLRQHARGGCAVAAGAPAPDEENRRRWKPPGGRSFATRNHLVRLLVVPADRDRPQHIVGDMVGDRFRLAAAEGRTNLCDFICPAVQFAE